MPSFICSTIVLVEFDSNLFDFACLDATLIRRDQVWFADKDEEGATHLYPLTNYKPRKGESLARGYLAGRYVAVPFIPSSLLGKETAANGG